MNSPSPPPMIRMKTPDSAAETDRADSSTDEGKRTMSDETLSRGINLGIVISAAILARRGEATLAGELLTEAGLDSMEDMRRIDADDYDVSALTDVLQEIERRTAALSPATAVQEQNTFEVGKPAPYFCPACQAVPRAGYCKLKGCPTAPAVQEQAP